jgi:hypothetical protein
MSDMAIFALCVIAIAVISMFTGLFRWHIAIVPLGLAAVCAVPTAYVGFEAARCPDCISGDVDNKLAAIFVPLLLWFVWSLGTIVSMLGWLVGNGFRSLMHRLAPSS